MTTKETDGYIASLEALQGIVNTYQQIASMRMRKIKDSVLQNREFYTPLLQTYQTVSDIYVKTFHKPFRQQTNGKSLALLITSNTGLYGNVNREVFDLFVKEQLASNFDLAVTGRLGKLWLDLLTVTKPYKYFDLGDDVSDQEAPIKALFDFFGQYAQVWVYHGLFKSIANQPAQVTKLTQTYTAENATGQTLSFLFEPSIDKVLENFEKQLSYAFFDQAIFEASLAKHGSRMMSLDSASQTIGTAVKKVKLVQTKNKHLKQNKRQLEQINAFIARRAM